MTALERDIRGFILKALLAAHDSPMPGDTLKGAITGAFPHVAFTGTELEKYLVDLKVMKFISDLDDEVFGPMWALTPKGKIRAQQLR